MIDSSMIGKIISFNVHPSAILGSNTFQFVKVLAILDAASTFQFIDPISLHANVFPTLPQGVPNKFDGYNYVKVQFQNGEVTALGIPWIVDGSEQIHTGTTLRATVFNTSAEDIKRLRDSLIANGFQDFEVNIVE